MSDDDVPGTLVLVDESGRSLEWHHSVEFDGVEHRTACRRDVGTENVRDVMMNPEEDWHEHVPPVDGCGSCKKSVMRNRRRTES